MKRTFHDNLGDWHGFTVAVETTGDKVWVGWCQQVTGSEVHLLRADAHEDGADGVSNDRWLKRAARWGVFPNHKSVKIPRDEVTSLTPLGEVETE